MKIVHIVQYLMQGHTYQENYLPHAMAKLGHDVTIISGTDNPDFYKDAPHESGDTLIDKGLVKVRYTKMRYRSLNTEIENIESMLCEENPDLIYVHGFILTRCFALRRYMLAHPRCRFVCDTHETFVLAFNACFTNTLKDRVRHFVYFGCVYRWWRRMVERHYEKVFYVSPPRKKYAMEAFGFHENLLESLWLGADLETLPYDRRDELRKTVRARYGLDENAKVMLLAGKLDRLKHPVELAEAFRLLDDKDWTLLYVGSMEDDVKADVLAALGEARDRVHFTGFIAGDAVLEYIAACDLAVYPGAPSVLWQQTVAQGIPAVFYEPEDGFASYLSDESAVFVRTGSAQETLDAIRPLTRDDAKRIEMGKRARKHGEEILSYDMLAKKALRIAFERSDAKRKANERA